MALVHPDTQRRGVAANHHPTSGPFEHTVDDTIANMTQMWGNVYSLFTNFAVIGMSCPHSVHLTFPIAILLLHQVGREKDGNRSSSHASFSPCPDRRSLFCTYKSLPFSDIRVTIQLLSGYML